MQRSDGVGDHEQLRRLRCLIEPTLSRLDVSDLLDELLRRVSELLDADVAVVMLRDSAGHLVPAATQTRQDHLHGSVHSTALQRFTERVARSDKPLTIAEMSSQGPAANSAGLRSLLGVSILANGEVIGTLQVGSADAREFTPDDLELLQVAADRVGVADQIRAHQAERAAALALQKGLLPTQLPTIPALTSAARYLPGHAYGVGGDWYDLLPLPSGWVGMIIGDVSGHGLASAVVMGRVRSALRAYTLVSDGPADALALLDEKIYRFEAGTLTTALYAVISPDRSIVHLSSAGHLPPVLAVPGRPATLVDMRIDAPLGIGRPGRVRHTTTTDLPPGAVLLAYTDGLVERRDQIIDVGIKTLVDTVEADDPDAVCTTVLTRFETPQPTDDIALLAVRR